VIDFPEVVGRTRGVEVNERRRKRGNKRPCLKRRLISLCESFKTYSAGVASYSLSFVPRSGCVRVIEGFPPHYTGNICISAYRLNIHEALGEDSEGRYQPARKEPRWGWHRVPFSVSSFSLQPPIPREAFPFSPLSQRERERERGKKERHEWRFVSSDSRTAGNKSFGSFISRGNAPF